MLKYIKDKKIYINPHKALEQKSREVKKLWVSHKESPDARLLAF